MGFGLSHSWYKNTPKSKQQAAPAQGQPAPAKAKKRRNDGTMRLHRGMCRCGSCEAIRGR